MTRQILIALLSFVSLHSQAQEDSLLRALKTPGMKKEVKASIEYELSKFYYGEYEDEKALSYVNAALKDFKAVKNDRQTAVAYNMKGNILADIGQEQKALSCYQSAVEIGTKIKNDTLIASFRNNIGLTYKSLGKYKEAVDELYACLRLKEKIGASEKSISATLLNIGLVWDLLEDSKKAEEYYKKSLVLKLKLNDSLGVSRIYSNLSVISKNRGKWSEAVKLIRLSQDFNASANDVEQDYINNSNLGNIYKLRKEYDQALWYLEKAHENATTLNNPGYLSDVCQNLGALHFAQKHYDLAIRYLDEALKIPNIELSIVQHYEIYESLSEAYAITGDYRKGHGFLLLSNTYRDSVFSVENQHAIQEVREKYETEKKEKTIALREAELSEAEADSNRKTTILVSLIAGVLILLLSLWIAFQYYRRKQLRLRAAQEERLEAYRTEIDQLQANIQLQLGDEREQSRIQLSQEELNLYLIDPLTEREQEVLEQMSLGKTNKEIADLLFISENTVKFHLKNVYIKLDVKNRTEAINKASALKIWNQS